MTQEPIIDKLERLEREATAAPWEQFDIDDDTHDGPRWSVEAMIQGQRPLRPGATKWQQSAADAALIVAMRNALPALLSQLREQREQWSDAELIAEVQRRGLVVD